MLLQCRSMGFAGSPVTAQLDATGNVQAVAHGVSIALAVGSVNSVPPAAKALLTSLGKVFAVAGVHGTTVHTALLVSRVTSRSWRPMAAHSAHMKSVVRAWQSPSN